MPQLLKALTVRRNYISTKLDKETSRAFAISNSENIVELTLPFSIISIACLSLLHARARSD